MTKTSKQILSTVKEEFNRDETLLSSFKIFVFYIVSDGQILFDDRNIDRTILEELTKHKKIRCEGLHFHQGERALRYRFTGYSYPYKYYRNIPKEIKKKVIEKDNESCVKCGSYHNLQIDHIFPWSKGGLSNIENLQVLCKNCNYEKSNKY